MNEKKKKRECQGERESEKKIAAKIKGTYQFRLSNKVRQQRNIDVLSVMLTFAIFRFSLSQYLFFFSCCRLKTETGNSFIFFFGENS